ncbi:MAG: response regulator transcription factor [Magnetococcales bacterium]|nr:response regulator transcription factor [Magnetococcales bacterium]
MKILLADDHPLILNAMPTVLKRLADDVEIINSVDFPSTFQMLQQNPDADLVLLDLSMPGMESFAAVSEICSRYPGTPIVILSGSEDPQHVQKVLDLGAAGFIPKTLPPDALLQVIRLILTGVVFAPTNLSNISTSAAQDKEKSVSQRGSSTLTPRQIDVLKLIKSGKSNKQIAITLSMSPETVKVHVAAIFRALRVKNRTQAAVASYTL